MRAPTRLKGYVALAVTAALILGTPLRPFAQTDLKGKSRDVALVPNATVNAGEIKFQADSDHDGMSDADEAANGTDPNDPSGADGDKDGDGLSNADEVAAGSNVNLADSDGDGVSDDEEARLGFDPNSPGSTPPTNGNVISIEVAPRALGLVINTLLGARPGQLTVTARLNNGSTAYGRAVGVKAGSTSFVVKRGSLTANVLATDTNFASGPLSSLAIPGYANNVKVVGNYAYVAAGSAGLQVSPAARLTAPAEGASLVRGETLTLKADASDNGGVSQVVFGVDGAEAGSDAQAPYEAAYQVPENVTSVTITATATDNLGRSTTASRTFQVVSDPLTTLTGIATGGGGSPSADRPADASKSASKSEAKSEQKRQTERSANDQEPGSPDPAPRPKPRRRGHHN